MGKDDEVEEVEAEIDQHFYGVYLLYCTNPKYLGRTYVGFTVNPLRRVNQHNKGSQFGGAKRTSDKGPWDMVLIVHGFPNDVAALRFEWAWQNPWRSRRLSHVASSRNSKRSLPFCLKIVTEMLNVGPWNRLSLTLRWLQPKYFAPLHAPLPSHMKIVKGALLKPQGKGDAPEEAGECGSCGRQSGLQRLRCLHCSYSAHAACWVGKLENGLILPIEVKCRGCCRKMLWGCLVLANRPPKSALAESQKGCN